MEEEAEAEGSLNVVRFGDGSKTLEHITYDIEDPQVIEMSDSALKGALRAWAVSAGSFVRHGGEHNIDPLILATIAGHESGGKTDMMGPGGTLGIMQLTEQEFMEFHTGSPPEDRIISDKSIEAAAGKFRKARSILKNEDAAVMAYDLGVNETISVVQGNVVLDEESKYYWPVIVLTHERLKQSLNQ